MGRSLLLSSFIIIAVAAIISFSLWVAFFPDSSSIDTDNDGYMNNEDLFPFDPLEHEDADNDGVGDSSDMFPLDPAASKDSDVDGYPDEWNLGKGPLDSTSNPVLKLDDFPFDPYEWIDSDDDDVGDNHDLFPYDSSEWADDDNDGVGNKKDKNPYVNLSFDFTLDSFKLVEQVDFFPRGQIYFELFIDDEKKAIWNDEGSYYRVWKNVETDVNLHFSYDIDDETTAAYTTLEIFMYDYDLFGSDDLLDLSIINERESFRFRIHHEENQIIADDAQSGPDAMLWYHVVLSEAVEPQQYLLEKTYEWNYNGEYYQITSEIPFEKYEWYKSLNPYNRRPQSAGSSAMASFVTPSDKVIQNIAQQLSNIAQNDGSDVVQTANFVLDFVQTIVTYKNDSVSCDRDEYWRYPLETLVEQYGDCEDSTILYATLMKNLDYDMVLLFYVLDDGTGHLASGVHFDTSLDFDAIYYNDIPYYYAETTNNGFIVGKRPDGIPEEPQQIIAL